MWQNKTKMAKKQSAGILLYRQKNEYPEFFLVHPGGLFWKNKDAGAWSIPKGEFTEEENAIEAAIREFEEEIGTKISGTLIELSPVKMKSGKIIYAWALEKDIDAASIKCSTLVTVEWPPRSGKTQSFPEIDKGAWFNTEAAKQKINPAQASLVDELIEKII